MSADTQTETTVAHDKPVAVTDATFADVVLASKLPVLVDFGADWCSPCKMMDKVLEKLAVEFAGKLLIVKINRDENPELVAKYAIQGIPHFLFMNGEEVVNRFAGAVPRSKMHSDIDAFLVKVGAEVEKGSPEARAEFEAIVKAAEEAMEKAHNAAGDRFKELAKAEFDEADAARKEFNDFLDAEFAAEKATMTEEEYGKLIGDKWHDLYNSERCAAIKARGDKAVEALNSGENVQRKADFFAAIEAATKEFDATVDAARERLLADEPTAAEAPAASE